MKNIIDLNIEINKIVEPEIEFHQKIQNIRFCKKWVNEINVDYFNDWEERIKNKISNIADLDSPSKVRFIKVFQQDVLEKYDALLKIDYNNLDILKSIPKTIFLLNKELKKPITKIQEYSFTTDDCSFEETLTRLAEIYKIIDFDFYDGQHDPETHKDLLQDEVLYNLKVEVDQLESIYSYVYLSLFLDETRTMLGRITIYIDHLVNLIKKLENFEEDKLSLEDINELDPNNIKLEFKINKKEIAILFKNLNDFGIFHIDNKGFKHKHTQLKKYIDNANMYFPHNGEIKPVKGISKEFAKVYGMEERVMHQDMEKKFLKGLIENLTERIKEIDSEDD